MMTSVPSVYRSTHARQAAEMTNWSRDGGSDLDEQTASPSSTTRKRFSTDLGFHEDVNQTSHFNEAAAEVADIPQSQGESEGDEDDGGSVGDVGIVGDADDELLEEIPVYDTFSGAIR